MKRYISILVVLLACVVASYAGEKTSFFKRENIRFAYDVDFEMNFDNREFYRSNFSNSMTIFGARLAPAIGLESVHKNGTSHRIMVGADIMKDFGSNSDKSKMLKEITLYYRLEKKIKKTEMTIYAGIFSRDNMEGHYSEAFFSDSLKFYDNNLEGILLKFKRRKQTSLIKQHLLL